MEAQSLHQRGSIDVRMLRYKVITELPEGNVRVRAGDYYTLSSWTLNSHQEVRSTGRT
jgi:hypothetical protein